MRKLVLSLMAILSIDGCSKMDNRNHCGFTDAFCANSDAGPSCNMISGQCEQVPLVIDNISPATPTLSDRVSQIKGNGFYDVISILVNGIEISRSVKVNSPTEIEVDLQALVAASGGSPFLSTRCGPVPVKVTRKDGASVTAEEKTGRAFSRWKYEMPYPLAAQNLSGVGDFAFANFDRAVFDYLYYVKNGAEAKINSKSNAFPIDSVNFSKINYIKGLQVQTVTGSFALHSRSTLKVGTLSNLLLDITAADACGGSYEIIDQYSIANNGMIESLRLACASTVSAGLLKTKKFNITSLSADIVSNYKASNPIQVVSFAPNSSECAVAIAFTPGVPGTVLPICDNTKSEVSPESLTGFEMIGTFESVASTNLAVQGKTRHYVLSRSPDSLVMEVFDTSRPKGLERFFVTPIVFKSDDIGAFSSFGAKIEVKDINCDDKMDVIIKTDRRVVAYLGISDTSWEPTPKVLFEMPSTDANTTIKKAALWIPDYRTTTGVGVLGILDSNGKLSLYQQQ